MLESVQLLIKKVGKQSGLTKSQINNLLKFDAEHQFDIKLENGKSFKAYRVQHNNKLGPYKGGVRFHSDVNLDEVQALATLMSLKTAAVGLPLGGGKGGVSVDPKSLSLNEIEELARNYARQLTPYIGPEKDILAPDVNTNSKIIDWMVEEYESETGETNHASFTGKSISKGGSLGRDAATGRGGVIALSELLRLQNIHHSQLTYAIQGFGNVGAFFALEASKEKPNWKLIAASDSQFGVKDVQSLDVKKLFEFKKNGGRFSEFKDYKKIANDELLGTNVDVLVLAALGDAVNEMNVNSIKAKYIVEMANGPISESAFNMLVKKNVLILPDIIANAGGVIVSYLEWQQNLNDDKLSETEVNQLLDKYIKNAVKHTFEFAKSNRVTLTEAALAIALKKLAN